MASVRLSAAVKGVRQLAARYTSLLETRPLATNFLTGGALACGSDIICQKVIEEEASLDYRRLASLTAFGLFYNGHVSYRVYQLYPRILPKSTVSTPGRCAVSMSMADNFVHSPLLYTPAFYLGTGLLQGESWSQAQDSLAHNYWPTLQACWVVWIPLQGANFGLVPKTHQCVFVNVANVAWNIIIDWIAHNN